MTNTPIQSQQDGPNADDGEPFPTNPIPAGADTGDETPTNNPANGSGEQSGQNDADPA